MLSGGAPTASLGQPGVLRAVALSGAFLALFALLGLGIGTVIRHTAGAIAVFAGVTFLVPILFNSISHGIARFAPELIFANSVAAVVPAVELAVGHNRGRAHARLLRRCARAGRPAAQPAGRVTPDSSEDSSVRVRIRGRELSLAMTEEQSRPREGRWPARCCTSPSPARRGASWASSSWAPRWPGSGWSSSPSPWAPGSCWPSPSSAWPSWPSRCGAPGASAGCSGAWRGACSGETVEDPQPFVGRPGFLGWLQSCLRDRVAWRAVGYLALRCRGPSSASSSPSACGGTPSSS